MGLQVVLLGSLVCAAACAQDRVVPLTVCEILHDLTASQGKNVAVLGRYSFREVGSWVGEQLCEPAAGTAPTQLASTTSATPAQLWLVEDPIDGPRLPEHFDMDAAAVHHKMVEMARHTTLGKFRFGTPDYDRWAVIYGRVEPRKTDDKKGAANLVIRGTGVIVFVRADQ
jgi:hypothetical protein